MDGPREQQRALDRVVRYGGQRTSEGLAFGRRGVGVDRGCIEWVARPQPPPIGDEHAGAARLVDPAPRLVAEDALDEMQRRGGGHRDDQQAAPSGLTEPREVVAHEWHRGRRDRERLVGRGRLPVGHDGAADLHGHERVAAADRMDPDEERARVDDPLPSLDEAPERADGEWPDVDPFRAVVRTDHRRHIGRGHRGPPRVQERDGRGSHPPRGECEGVAARSVAPLDVVDGDEERAIPRQHAHHVRDRDADQAGVDPFRRSGLVLAATQGGIERPAPWRDQGADRGLGGRIIEQRLQHDERELALRLARTPGEDAVASRFGPGDGIGPQRRLPDPGLAFDEQHRGSGRLEPLGDPRPLLVAADHLRVAADELRLVLTRLPGFPWFHGCLRPRLPRSSERPASNQGYHDEDVGPE